MFFSLNYCCHLSSILYYTTIQILDLVNRLSALSNYIITTDHSFLDNTYINESNSLVNLVDHPSNEHELYLIEHSIYYNNETFRQEISNVNGSISVLNLNCGGLNTKFDKLKLFLAFCNDMNRPISVITQQETHLDSSTYTILFNLSDYTLISDHAQLFLP